MERRRPLSLPRPPLIRSRHEESGAKNFIKNEVSATHASLRGRSARLPGLSLRIKNHAACRLRQAASLYRESKPCLFCILHYPHNEVLWAPSYKKARRKTSSGVRYSLTYPSSSVRIGLVSIPSLVKRYESVHLSSPLRHAGGLSRWNSSALCRGPNPF